MSTLLLKSNNLKLLESTLDMYIQNNMTYKLLGFAKTAINLNKVEAFKIIYNKSIQKDNKNPDLNIFLKETFLKACEYKRNKILSFLFSQEEFQIDSFNQKIGFSFAIKNKTTFKLLVDKYTLKEEYYTDIIYSLVCNYQKKNKKHIYYMTDILINKFGYFPSEKLYNKILENKSFEKLNSLRNRGDFKFSEYLDYFEQDKYIIYNYKSLLLRNSPSIEEEYDIIIKKIKISNF
tara:strand:- start:2348 stop:3049 length:702 start_codon:yes stop_codon:yes gene_type:complete